MRKVLWYIPLKGSFNEYADVSIYVSDIFILIILASVFIKSEHIIDIMSIIRRCFTGNNARGTVSSFLIITLPFALIIWAAFSLFYAIEPSIGAVFVLKMVELYGVYLLVIFCNVPCETNDTKRLSCNFKGMLGGIIFMGVLEAVLGIVQFFKQHSLGLTFIKESVISPVLPGVAKVIINNTHYIRAYGTFPHPNILGGFLFVSIILSHLYFRLFYVEQAYANVRKLGVLLLQYTAIIVTFSKSAILGLIIALLYISIVSHGTIRGTQIIRRGKIFLKEKVISAKQKSFLGSLLVIGMVSLMMIFSRINMDTLFFQSLRERALYQSVVVAIIYKHPILGISCGQLVIFMAQQSIYPLFDWQLQPVHNIFLLIWAELGVVGFFIFTLWYVLLAIVVPVKKISFSRNGFSKEKHRTFKELYGTYIHALVIGFIPILLFDHYLWDIQQGQIIFWVVMALNARYIITQIHKIGNNC
jgi:hypothetical protein